ncbi:hypothetical protein Tco_0287836, partial [Tanacetum coccineum]
MPLMAAPFSVILCRWTSLPHNDLVQEKECNILNIASNNTDSCCRSNNDDGLVLKEVEAFKGSELDLQNELRNLGSTEEIKPDGPTDIPEQSAWKIEVG